MGAPAARSRSAVGPTGVEEALAGRVGEEQLEHRLGRAVGRRGRLPRSVVDGAERELAAEHRQRAREHQPRRRAMQRQAATSARPPSRLTSSARSKSRSRRRSRSRRGADRDLGAVERRVSNPASRMSPRGTSRRRGRRAARPQPARRAGAARPAAASLAADGPARSEHPETARDYDVHRPMIAADGCRRRRCRADGLADRRRVRVASHRVRASRGVPEATQPRVDEALATVRRLALRSEAATAGTTARIAVRPTGCDRALRSRRRVGARGSRPQGRGVVTDRRALPRGHDREQHIVALDRRVRRGLRRARAHCRHPLLEPAAAHAPGGGDRGSAQPARGARAGPRGIRELRQRPAIVQRDVPGFIWSRLQHALLREALWIIDDGVATPEAVDEVVRFGNARRWERRAVRRGRARRHRHVAAGRRRALPRALERPRGGRPRARPLGRQGKLAEIAAARDAGLARDLREA